MKDITSRANPLIKHLTQLGRDAGCRREHGLMLCEGGKMLAEALSAGVAPRHAVFSRETEMSLPPETEVIRAPSDVIKSISRLDNPSDILFTAPIPDLSIREFSAGTHVILDRLQDPGNVGSIIRSARALGIDSVTLTPGCADVTNPKTLRAAMGAVFSQRLAFAEPADIINALSGFTCYITGTEPDAIPLGTVDMNNCAVVIGSEGSGVSDIWRAFDMLTIPIEFESLGAASAAAIIMWEMRKC